MFGIVKDKP